MTAFASHSADPTAVVGRRIGAWAIDLVIYIVFASALTALIGAATVETADFGSSRSAERYCSSWRSDHTGFCFALPTGDESAGASYSSMTIENPERNLIVVATHLLAYALVQGLLGASLGKRAVGLAVVDADGRPLGLAKSFVRTGMWVVDGIVFTFPVLGGLFMVATKGHRRVGDMVAGTFVVDRAQVGHPVLVPGLNAPFAVPAAWGGPAGPTGWVPPQGWGGTPSPGWGGAPPTGNGGSWSPPATSGPTPSEPVSAVRAPLDDGPHWDDARDTYIQYDRGQEAWLQWDETRRRWGPIDQ